MTQHKNREFMIKVDDEKLDKMGEWCQRQHGESGLTEACRKSQTSLAQAEDVVCKMENLSIYLSIYLSVIQLFCDGFS